MVPTPHLPSLPPANHTCPNGGGLFIEWLLQGHCFTGEDGGDGHTGAFHPLPSPIGAEGW